MVASERSSSAAAETRPDRTGGVPRRILRAGIAGLAVLLAGAVGVVAPGSQPAEASGNQLRAVNALGVEASPTPAPFDRGSSVSRGGQRDAGSLSAAAAARATQLGAVSKDLDATQLRTALSARQASLSTETGRIKGEANRLNQRGGFFRPTNGELGSKFGPRMHPILHYTRLHAGWDMGGNCGQPIWAARDGKVVLAAQAGQSGNYLRIDHGTVNGTKVETSYQHMQSFTVKAGDTVKRGQVVGYVGNTGLSTACHLHFGVIANGENADPGQYLEG